MLGDNTTDSKSSPIQTVAGGTNWKQLGQGNNGCAAIKTDGTLWTWGYNIDGQLGDNTQISKSSPVQTVAGGTNWKQVAGGNQTIAIREDFY
jgi:alpha-tubulin suppressor-like RCC1 family protein